MSSPSRSKNITCSGCGDKATVAWVHPNTSPNIATPYCDRCANDNSATEQDIADHEMSNFGGMYGTPSHKEYPIDTFKWFKREDGRFEANL